MCKLRTYVVCNKLHTSMDHPQLVLSFVVFDSHSICVPKFKENHVTICFNMHSDYAHLTTLYLTYMIYQKCPFLSSNFECEIYSVYSLYKVSFSTILHFEGWNLQ